MVQRIIDNIVNSFRRSTPSVYSDGVLSQEAFSRVLERERERSDRSGQGFSLVVFKVGAHNTHPDLMRVLIYTILSRSVRATDEVGWFKEGSVATLLACTSLEGAWKFAKDVVSGIPAGIDTPTFSVFTYPTSGNGAGDARKDRNGDIIREMDSRDSSERTEPVADASLFEYEPLENKMGSPIPLWKRFLDILGALVGLILLSPLFLIVAIFIKIVSPGPVFFRQERIGFRGKVFTLWKFRSMHVNNNTGDHLQHITRAIDSDTPVTKLDDLQDNRIIPFGKLLRSSCIDEFPQLLNVLKGDMSLIGPRPCLQYEAEKLQQWQKRRFDAMPGMSGLWQVSGKNRTTFKEMIRFDIRYSRKLSIILDAKILLYTVPSILGMVFDLHPKHPKLRREPVGLTALHMDMPFRR